MGNRQPLPIILDESAELVVLPDIIQWMDPTYPYPSNPQFQKRVTISEWNSFIADLRTILRYKKYSTCVFMPVGIFLFIIGYFWNPSFFFTIVLVALFVALPVSYITLRYLETNLNLQTRTLCYWFQGR